MKKYTNLGSLIIDYRQHKGMSQADVAALLDIDIRTIARWEKNETLVKPEKEKDIVERLLFPYQVVRNLNAEWPLAIYYDLQTRRYSQTALSMAPIGASWFKQEYHFDTERIHTIAKDSDIEFVADIQDMNYNSPKPIKASLIKEASKIIPELNLVLHDQSGFYAGHIAILPLKYEAYEKIKNREMSEGSLEMNDLKSSIFVDTTVLYYYSLYAESRVNSYYLMKSLLDFFRNNKFEQYLFAGISYRKDKIQIFNEMGLKTIWEDIEEQHRLDMVSPPTLLEGNFDNFLNDDST